MTERDLEALLEQVDIDKFNELERKKAGIEEDLLKLMDPFRIIEEQKKLTERRIRKSVQEIRCLLKYGVYA